MISEVIAAVVSLVAGFLTGLFFERRALKSAIDQNDRLRRQLNTLLEGIYTVGGGSSGTKATLATGDLAADMLAWATAFQDPSGRISVAQLVTQFVSIGSSRSDIDNALAQLVAAASIRVVDRWVEVL